MSSSQSAVSARIDLVSAEAGGLAAPMPSPTRSILLAFAPGGCDEQMAGARISARDSAFLAPGDTDVTVILEFWTDAAAALATVGSRFELRYPPHQVIGRGLVESAQGDASR